MSISYSDSIITRMRGFSEKELPNLDFPYPVRRKKSLCRVKNMRAIFPNHSLRLEIILLS